MALYTHTSHKTYHLPSLKVIRLVTEYQYGEARRHLRKSKLLYFEAYEGVRTYLRMY